LIEILVVIAVIAVLASILIPVARHAIFEAKVTDSTNRMRSLGQAIQLYASDNNMQFPGNGYNATQRWFHQVAPYLGTEADGYEDGVPYFTGAYGRDELFSCPALSGEPKEGGGTYLARFGLNRLLYEVGGESMTGLSMLQVVDPSKTVMLATKASVTPGLHFVPYPAHSWGISGNYERGRSPEAGMGDDGFLGRHGVLFCDGHLEVRETFVGREAFEPNPNARLP
jgi:hypothetical protein